MTSWKAPTRGLSQEDLAEYEKLHKSFKDEPKSKSSRVLQFTKELLKLVDFVNRSPTGRERRCIACGIGFGGAFVCVNTSVLQGFMAKSKSSINLSFQGLGYCTLRTKAKVQAILLSVMPSLISDKTFLRYWTIRYPSTTARFCVLTQFIPRSLPSVTEADFLEEIIIDPEVTMVPGQAPRMKEHKPALFPMSEFDLPSLSYSAPSALAPEPLEPEWCPLDSTNNDPEAFSFI